MEKRRGEEGNHGNLKSTPPEIFFCQRHPGLSFHNFLEQCHQLQSKYSLHDPLGDIANSNCNIPLLICRLKTISYHRCI